MTSLLSGSNKHRSSLLILVLENFATMNSNLDNYYAIMMQLLVKET